MNRIYRRSIKNAKTQKLGKKNSSQHTLLQKQETLDGFNIIELNETEINSDIISDLPNLSEKDIARIKKKAQAIEGYYLGKGEDTKINENCFNCLMNDFQANELLYFSKRKDLLAYLRYCFYFLKKIIFLDNQIYTENKYDLDKCNTNYLNGWKFFIPKTMCKGCFLQMINMEHLFGNLKTIFSDVDATTLRKNFRRNRSRLTRRLRPSNSHNKNEESGRVFSRRRIWRNPKRKNFRYSIKKNKSISFDNKNGLILLKKDILSEELMENLRDKIDGVKKIKFLGKKKHLEENRNKELLVTEIKIKTNELLNGNNLCKNTNNENNIINTKNIKEIKPELISKSEENKQNNNLQIIKNNMENTPTIINSNNINKNIFENKKTNLDKEKKISNLYKEIMTMKGMSNKIVLKLYRKLDNFLYWINYTLFDVYDFKQKLDNTLNLNPIIIANIVTSTLSVYENNYGLLYNEIFKNRKEFEEIFKKIKNDSIPTIAKNLAKLKEQPELKEEEIKTLDELNKTLDDYTKEIAELEIKYDCQIKNYFNNFSFFLELIGEIKESFS